MTASRSWAHLCPSPVTREYLVFFHMCLCPCDKTAEHIKVRDLSQRSQKKQLYEGVIGVISIKCAHPDSGPTNRKADQEGV